MIVKYIHVIDAGKLYAEYQLKYNDDLCKDHKAVKI